MSASPDPHTATGHNHSAPTIILTGGGSGGHITPLLAVAHQLKQRRPDIKLVYVGLRGEKLSEVIEASPDIDQKINVWAGKWRRYHGEMWRQFFDLPLIYKNLRDLTRLMRGIWQSYFLLGRLMPVGVLVKGSQVGVPVGLAAHFRKVPIVTHDSDVIPGLANQFVGRWAVAHAVGMPAELYNYPPSKTKYIGVPVRAEFQPVTADLQNRYRQEIGLSQYDQVILVTGGGLGAQLLNEAMVRIVPSLLQHYPKLAIVHATGPDHDRTIEAAYEAVLSPLDRQRVMVKGYIQDMHNYSGAADLIITRAGATTLAEWAAQGRACIVIPNPALTGGHQIKNTEALADKRAIIEVPESDLKNPKALPEAVRRLLDDPNLRQELMENISQFAKPHAASDLAELLLSSFNIVGREG